MDHIMVTLMSQLTTLTEEEALAIEESFPIITFAKGTYLLKAGQIARDAWYVVKGCVREYELIDGEERTLAFYTEDHSVANFHSLANGTASKQNFICMENSTLGVLNAQKEQQLYDRFPRFETFCRTGMEEMMGMKHDQLSQFMIMSPKERYLKLLKERPDLVNRVPQYQLASYLGIKPETLSRIRKRMVKEG